MTSFKIPREFEALSERPKNTLGKVLKRELANRSKTLRVLSLAAFVGVCYSWREGGTAAARPYR